MTGVVEVGLWGDVNEAFFGNEVSVMTSEWFVLTLKLQDGTVLHKRREVAE